MPPQPVAAWSDERTASDFGAPCPQPAGTLSSMNASDEDCLFLNVYTPADAEKLPVMVFIHGGAFVTGGGDQYEGQSMSEAGHVIVVTLNYRLGALGFFSHPKLDAMRTSAPSGSDGLRDQQLAIRFVKDNIAAFGGDASQLTLFGESAGSASTCLHFVAPSSRTLAQRYIMESGACLRGGLGSATKESADALGTSLGDALCSGESDVIACLRDQTADALVNWGADQGLFGAGWGPSVEGPGGILPDTTEKLIADASFKPAPIIIGTNKREWGLFQLLGNSQLTSVAALEESIDKQFGDVSAQVKDQYHASDDGQANEVDIRLMTDLTFRCSTRALARAVSDKGGTVYLYSFEQGTAYHAQELDYVFGSDVLTAFGGGPKVPALQDAVQGYWTQFAKSGDPNGGDRPSWPRYETSSDRNLTLVDPPAAASGLAESDCDFWQKFLAGGGTIQLDL
jgi:para-nitrobenzyl esterase